MADSNPTPFAVALVGALYLLVGVLGIIAGIIGLFAGGGIPAAGLIVASVIPFVIALGFFKGWSIMWYLGIVFSVIGIISVFFLPGVGIISLIINVIIILSLFKPNVKAYFLE